jgi:hypothetical protein
MPRVSTWQPVSAVIVQGFTPTSGEANDSQFSATCVFGWTLPNEWVWDTAIRCGTGSLEEDHFDVSVPSTVLKIPLSERWRAHAEYFGVFSSCISGGTDPRLSTSMEVRCGLAGGRWDLSGRGPPDRSELTRRSGYGLLALPPRSRQLARLAAFVSDRYL